MALPASPWADGAIETLATEGAVRRRAWRIGGSATTLQLLVPIRTALEAAGFAIRFECETAGCGGFDFRLAAPVIPEPAMHVNLGSFRYLLAAPSAAAGTVDGAAGGVAVLVSRAAAAGFVQVIEVSPAGTPPPSGPDRAVAEALGLAGPPPGTSGSSGATGPGAPLATGAGAGPAVSALAGPRGANPAADPAADPAAAPAAAPAAERPAAGDPDGPRSGAEAGATARGFEALGHVPLDDLAFAPGSVALAAGSFASLAALAEWMRENPAARILLVGHTDATGSLAANITLSRSRAQSVAERLVSDHGLPRARLAAEGAGPLAPRATNATEAGRTANRRVEAVLALD